jgi:bifunctional UDP-N-acetylglucosamine pyrophosphorylase/glucosamine-1-phosphate N-acetyltransferase
MQAETLLRGQADLLLVTYGDMPLLTAASLEHIIALQQAHTGPITMLTMLADDPRGFGRIVRNSEGFVQAIVEEAQATPEQRAICELNPGVYCFEAEWLWQALQAVPLSPKGEYYLTDVIAMAVAQGRTVQAEVMEDAEEAIGVNTRVHLAEAAAILRRRVNEAHMLAGVTLIDPATTYIEPGVEIGQDTVIWPNTSLHGQTTIGGSCAIGPNTIVRHSRIGSYCKVLASVLDQAVMEDRVEIGPFGHLRKGAHLAEGVHLGNFGEVKNSYLGPETKMGHFSYIGDADLARHRGLAQRHGLEPVEAQEAVVADGDDRHAEPVAHHQRDGL